VAIPRVLPAYITVEAYHANLARLAANAARAETPGRGARGAALLSCLGFGWYEGRAMRRRKGERLRVRLVRKC
jgi:hypothetical protein